MESLYRICIQKVKVFSLKLNQLPKHVRFDVENVATCCFFSSPMSAALNGHEKCLVYGLSTCNQSDEEQLRICGAAASIGNLACLRAARSAGCRWDETTCLMAANNNRMACLKYLRDNHCPWDVSVPMFAVAHENFEILKYAVENQCPTSPHLCFLAVRLKRKKFLEFLVENGCECDRFSYNEAARTGNLDLFEIAREAAGTRDPETLEIAARENHNHILFHALEHGWEWNDDILLIAAETGNVEILEYAVEKNVEKKNEQVFTVAVTFDRLDFFKRAHEKGFRCMFQATLHAAGKGRLKFLEYIYSQYSCFPEEACEIAAMEDHLECLEFMLGKGAHFDPFCIEFASRRCSQFLSARDAARNE